VFRARDTNLDRDVAIKVLPESFAKAVSMAADAPLAVAARHAHGADDLTVEHDLISTNNVGTPWRKCPGFSLPS
jgi:hypothetical protein